MVLTKEQLTILSHPLGAGQTSLLSTSKCFEDLCVKLFPPLFFFVGLSSGVQGPGGAVPGSTGSCQGSMVQCGPDPGAGVPQTWAIHGGGISCWQVATSSSCFLSGVIFP